MTKSWNYEIQMSTLLDKLKLVKHLQILKMTVIIVGIQFLKKCSTFLKAENHKVEFMIKSWNYGIVIIKTR